MGGINSVIFVPENENRNREGGPISCENFVFQNESCEPFEFFPPLFVFVAVSFPQKYTEILKYESCCFVHDSCGATDSIKLLNREREGLFSLDLSSCI